MPLSYLDGFTVFSNILKDTQIHILADSDELEVVQQVQVTLWWLSTSLIVLFYFVFVFVFVFFFCFFLLFRLSLCLAC